MEIKIIKSYFSHHEDQEYIVVEYLTKDELVNKLIKIEEVLDYLFTVPMQSLPDSKLLKKAEELVLKGLVEI